jgi:hypothetical protein
MNNLCDKDQDGLSQDMYRRCFFCPPLWYNACVVRRRTSMSAIPTVPVRIMPEAAARVKELGLQTELDQMMEHIHLDVPQLRCIDVELEEPYDTGGEPEVSIRAWSLSPWQQQNDIWWVLARWQAASFPPEVRRHLSIEVLYGSNDAGESIPGTGAGADQG